MKQKLLLAMLVVALPTSALAGDESAPRVSTNGAEAIAHCFAATQEKASKPWSFVPREGGGGTFSNAGAAGVKQPYFVRIADRGPAREVRIEAQASDANVVRAVGRCI